MQPTQSCVPVTRQVAAEAAVWVSRLHGPNRSPALEAKCCEWQSQSEAHRQAFERCTAVWDAVPGVSVTCAYRARPSGAMPAGRRGWGWAVAAIGCALAVFVGLHGFDPAVATRVGEQRVVRLEDGSRVALNTGTRIRVSYSGRERRIALIAGEALFEVTKDARRPFVVSVGTQQEVRALGTVFSIRRDDASVAVALLEGKVAITPAPAGAAGRTLAPPSAPADAVALVTLAPGERLVMLPSTSQERWRRDQPRMDQITAWRRGEAIFDDTPLDAAVREMNRYSQSQIVLAQGRLRTHRVSGVFRTGDTQAFAQALAALHGLRVADSGAVIELSDPGASPVPALSSTLDTP